MAKRKDVEPVYDHPADDPDQELALADRVERAAGLPAKNR